MSILTVVQDVCAVVGITIPTGVFANISTDRTMQELVACANEVAQRIAYDTREWTKLKLQQTYTGDGTTTAFNMPANYKRMLLTSQVWRSTSTQQPMTFISDTDEWLRRRAAGEEDAWGEWTLLGGQMHIYPAMEGVIPAVPPELDDTPAVYATFAYLDRKPIESGLNPGTYAERFTNDEDSFRLDERLLKLGMIVQWKAQKGSPYAEDMGSFSDALGMMMGADKPGPILISGTPISAHARVAIPWPSGWGPAA